MEVFGIHTMVNAYDNNRCIFSAPYSNIETSICTDNLLRSTVYFTIRSLIKPTIYNEGDDFLLPDNFVKNIISIENTGSCDDKEMEEFIYDSLIFSIFNNHSNQSSLRKSNGTSDDVFNQWFFISKNEIYNMSLNNEEILNDLKLYGKNERYIFNFIEKNKTKFSNESIAVLNSAKKVIFKSFIFRNKINLFYPEIQINTWDAGFWQIKEGLKKINKLQILDNFNDTYQKLENKLKNKVYKLGFLK